MMKTLFLDRDGVINQCMPAGQYVRSWQEFRFVEGSVQAIVDLGRFFTKIIVVTNQQGVGKNIMPPQELEAIHCNMQDCLRAAGRPVDAIYYCPHLESIRCCCRKPMPGMAMQAKRDFPAIDFRRSAMAGDSPSDLAFGRNLGMKTVLLGSKPTQGQTPDFQFETLLDFSKHLQKHPAKLFS